MKILCTSFGCLALVILTVLSCDQQQSAPSTPLNQSIYIWQRQWGERVPKAIRSIDPAITDLVPLITEIHYPHGKELSVVDIKLNPNVLQTSGKSITGGIRIPYVRKWDESSCDSIVKQIKRQQSQKPLFKRIQIDYDCPQSKLADYGNLLQILSKEFGQENLSFTALPSWLNDKKAFRQLTQYCHYYVLQVHWLDSKTNPPQIINPNAAQNYINSASQMGAPFQVALPTYGSFVIYDAQGKVIDVVSEDLPSRWPDNATAKLAWAKPNEVAELVDGWQKDRPKHMLGFAWYRLPVEGDLLNWPMATFNKVKNGATPKQSFDIKTQKAEGGATIISLTNSGEQPAIKLPTSIKLSSQTSIDGADGTQFYKAEQQLQSVTFQFQQQKHDLLPFPPGRSIVIGWLRTQDGPLDIKIE